MDIIERFKDVVKLVKAYNNVDLNRKISELQTEVLELRRENTELKQKLDFAKSLKFIPPFYYAEGDETPYCPVCWEGKYRRPIHMHLIEGDTKPYRCPVCGFYKDTQNISPREQPPFLDFSKR